MNTPRLLRRKTVLFLLLAIFLIPVAARAALFTFEDRPRSFRDADWSSTHTLPEASAFPEARVMVMSGRTGGWKGVIAVHSWIVFKRENAKTWTRYDVVGWGNPLRLNGWPPDARWYGTAPTVVADIRGAEAQALIPRSNKPCTTINSPMPAITGSIRGRTATRSSPPSCVLCRR